MMMMMMYILQYHFYSDLLLQHFRYVRMSYISNLVSTCEFPQVEQRILHYFRYIANLQSFRLPEIIIPNRLVSIMHPSWMWCIIIYGYILGIQNTEFKINSIRVIITSKYDDSFYAICMYFSEIYSCSTLWIKPYEILHFI